MTVGGSLSNLVKGWGLLLRPGKQGGRNGKRIFGVCVGGTGEQSREGSSGDGELSKTGVNIEKGR